MTESTETPGSIEQAPAETTATGLSQEEIATAMVQAALTAAARNLYGGNSAMVAALVTRALTILPDTLPANTDSKPAPSAAEIDASHASSIAEYAYHLLMHHGRPELSEALAERALALIGDNRTQSVTVARALSSVGSIMCELGRATEAIAPLEQALTILDAIKPDVTHRHPDQDEAEIMQMVSFTVQILAFGYMSVERFDDAAPLVDRVRAEQSPDSMLTCVLAYDQHLAAIAEALKQVPAGTTDLDMVPGGKIPKRLLN